MRLTKRGERLFTALLIIGALALALGIYEVIGHLWWDGDSYCWGTMLECMEGGL